MGNQLKEKLAANTKDFFRLFEEKDFDQWILFWAEDGINRNPYATGMVPEKTVGREEIYNHFVSAAERFSIIKFSIHEIIVEEEKRTVVVRLDGKLTIKRGGIYENTYIFLFHFNENNKIRECFEYFNPYIAGKAFGLLDKLKIWTQNGP